jgi:hypothetical protein
VVIVVILIFCPGQAQFFLSVPEKTRLRHAKNLNTKYTFNGATLDYS